MEENPEDVPVWEENPEDVPDWEEIPVDDPDWEENPDELPDWTEEDEVPEEALIATKFSWTFLVSWYPMGPAV